MLAFANSSITTEEINNLLNTIEIKQLSSENVITSEKIAENVLELLKQDYPVAYVRYTSVYKNFTSLDDFKNLLQ